MPNLGTGEIIIVAIVLLVIFGGKKLPELARGIGEAGREFRRGIKGDDSPTQPKKDNPESTN